MENQINVEQPVGSTSETDLSLEEGLNQSSSLDTNSGSTLGKFKDATSLLAAYDALEKEFTRKSQKLSEVQRKLNMMENGSSVGLAQGNVEGLTNINHARAVSTENKSEDNINNNQTEALDTLKLTQEKYEKSMNWKRKVDGFFSRHADGRDYSLEMGKILKSNPELRSSENGLELAYNLAKSKGLKKPAELIEDPNFISQYIMNNEKIKSEIIKDYLNNIKSNSDAPRIIKSNTNTVYASASPRQPKTIEDAARIVSKMFGGR